MQRIISPFLLSVLCASAVADPAPPVVGGSAVKRGTWPDVVAVLGDDASCTGTLIAPDVVLTAGHCIEIPPKWVLVDVVDMRHPAGGEVIDVKSAHAYPDWEHTYDVGVLVLQHVAKPKPRAIASACTAEPLLAARKPVTVIGFGLTSPSGTDDNTELHQAQLPILDPTCAGDPTCEAAVRPNGEFTAGGRGTDSCFGDSGGPAMLDTKDGPVLAGVVSRGLVLPGAPCGNGGVYVRADKVAPWIEKVTGRTLARTMCDGHGDDPALAAAADDTGGCSAGGGGAGLALGMALIAGVWRRRATRGDGVRPDDRGLVRAEARPAPVADADRAAVRADADVASRAPSEDR